MKKKVIIYSFAVFTAILLSIVSSNAVKSFELSDSLTDLITLSVANAEYGGGGGGTYTCSSGGPGSSQCSTSSSGGGGGITGGFSCSVTCNSGYYACCNTYHNKCQCRKDT